MAYESRLQARVIDLLEERGHYVVNVHAGGFTGKGTADLLACVCGQFIAFELKDPKGVVSPAQVIKGKRIRRAGGQWYTPQTVAEVVSILDRIERENNDRHD